MCCIDAMDVKTYYRKVNEENWILQSPMSSLAGPIAVESGTEGIKIEIKVSPSDRLDVASVKESDNIGTYMITLEFETGENITLGPVSIISVYWLLYQI